VSKKPSTAAQDRIRHRRLQAEVLSDGRLMGSGEPSGASLLEFCPSGLREGATADQDQRGRRRWMRRRVRERQHCAPGVAHNDRRSTAAALANDVVQILNMRRDRRRSATVAALIRLRHTPLLAQGLAGGATSPAAAGPPCTAITVSNPTPCSRTTRSVIVFIVVWCHSRRVNVISIVTLTATAWPSFAPGLNSHCFAALTASASSPKTVSSDSTTVTSPTVPSAKGACYPHPEVNLPVPAPWRSGSWSVRTRGDHRTSAPPSGVRCR
jgi:hypothetical protein